MLQFVLCDDVKGTLNRISNYLNDIFLKYDMNAKVAFATTSPKQLLSYVENNSVDVFILDIDLDDQITGIEIAKKIRVKNKNAYIIFLTAHFEYSMIAYKVKTFDFLIKPLTNAKLEETILRLYEDIYDNTSSFVKIGNGKHIFKTADILYIEKSKAKAIVHTTTSDVQIYGTMDSIINCLPDYFIRCSKSYIVNIQKINRIDDKKHFIYINEDIINYSNKYINNERKMIFNERFTD